MCTVPTEISNWYSRLVILIEIQYQYWVGFSSDNFLINLVKQNIHIFQWLAFGVSLLLAYSFIEGYLDVSRQIKSKAVAITGALCGVLFFFILIVYYSLLLYDGAWERQAFVFWNWPLGITVFSWCILISLSYETSPNTHNNVSLLKFSALASQILILAFFLEATFFMGETTSTEVEISSNKGWQSGNLTVAKGQKVNIACDKSLWTINKNDLQNFPLSSTERISDANRLKDSSLPLQNANLGSLLARVGTDSKVYKVGIDTFFISETNGYIYLRINDRDDVLWDNSGSVKCRIGVFRSQPLQPFTFKNLMNRFVNFFVSE